jgi:hypothetical protein
MHPSIFVVVHPTCPWGGSNFIPDPQLRASFQSRCASALRRALRAATRDSDQIVVVVSPGDEEDLPATLRPVLAALRARANFTIDDEEAESARSAAAAIRRDVPAFGDATIAGFWRDRCCRDMAESLGLLPSAVVNPVMSVKRLS